MNRFDWSELMRAGLIGLGLQPDAFWKLTPAELSLLLGNGGQDMIDALDADVSALERTLGDASEVARAFDGQLRGVQQSLSETTRDLGNLERGFSGGLRRAFDGVFLDGMKLSGEPCDDALGWYAGARC